MDNPIKTKISQANWCTSDANGIIESAKFPEQPDIGIAWLDELLEGGLYVPNQGDRRNGRPLTFLLVGPPGTGKTTLALEMCYRLARDISNGCHSLYISAEAEAWKLQDKARRYGWSTSDFYVVPDNISDQSSEVAEYIKQLQEQRVVLWGARDIFENYILSFGKGKKDSSDGLYKTLNLFSRPLLKLLPFFLENESKDLAESLIETVNKVVSEPPRGEHSELINYRDFGLVVIDSLNVIPEDKVRSALFSSFLTSISGGPRIVLFILDSGSPEKGHRFWEHVSDVVVRLDYHYEERSKYLVRSIEVVKARYQTHVWGRHQLKIYPKTEKNIPHSNGFCGKITD